MRCSMCRQMEGAADKSHGCIPKHDNSEIQPVPFVLQVCVRVDNKSAADNFPQHFQRIDNLENCSAIGGVRCRHSLVIEC